MIGGIVGVLLLCAVGAFFLFGRTTELVGTVAGVTWQRSIAIMAQTPVRAADWRAQIPNDAKVLSCELKPRRYSNVQEPNSTQVCGTPYLVDQGNGTAKSVQDCQYRVSEQYCSYTRLQWTVINTLVARGTDLQPTWPNLALATGEREGNRAEEYRVIFDAGGQQYTYQPQNTNEFARFQRGSRWQMKVNGIGSITELQPAP